MFEKQGKRISDPDLIHWVLHERDRACLWGLYSQDRCRSQALHVHHIQKRSQMGPDDPMNLITLCAWHHDQAERREITASQLTAALTYFLSYR